MTHIDTHPSPENEKLSMNVFRVRTKGHFPQGHPFFFLARTMLALDIRPRMCDNMYSETLTLDVQYAD
jgi:hypothetical protein